MSITTITPDEVLAEMLNNNIIVNTTATDSHTIRAFASYMHPNNDLPSEYISVYPNGIIESMTKPIGYYKGNLAVAIYVETQKNGTIKPRVIRQIMEQCEAIVNCKAYNGFYFEFDPTNIITPTTTNLSTGYSTTIVNVEWHTSNQ